jgi:hypothetical protein
MTLAEFKAWLEGYEASFSGAPNADQWSAIKAKLADVQIVALPALPSYPSIPTTFPRYETTNPLYPTLWPNVTCQNGSEVTQ